MTPPPAGPSTLEVPTPDGGTTPALVRKRGISSGRVPTNPKMEEFLKSWRQDALNKHQYDAAIYIGDKLLALTGDPKDAFWLAQVHFSTGHYSRAQTFLTRNDLISRSTSCRYLAALCLIKQSKYDEALNVLGDKDPMHLFTSSVNERRRGGGGGSGPSRSSKDREEHVGNVKFEAAMCYLRGLVYAKQNSFDKAKECYKHAVLIDVKCFEAFDQLMRNSLMSPDEEWAFLESLDFDGLTADGEEQGEQAEFVKMLYTTRLSKYKNPAHFNKATEALSETYNLAQNSDMILSRAELLFTQCKFKECLGLCKKIIQDDNYNFSIYPLYLACLHELDEKNTLFLISHDMADNYPDEPVTWLSVGVYYLTIGKIAESRRFFSKASMMDPHFGPAWIGFAHTFAAEGEHDQAISAYSTAARLFQGTHLPQLFLGMQHLQLNNITLADEYLSNAFTLCKSDPLLLNELGVVFYHKDHLKESVQLFTKALDMADEIGSDPKAWIATRANLAHAYRRLERFDLAIEQFSIVKRTGEARDANVYGAVGLCQLQMGRPWEAVVSLHEALAISPQDPIATELLERALEENSSSPHLFRSSVMTALGEIVVQDDEQVDCHVEQRVAAAAASSLSCSSSALALAARNGKQKGRARPLPPRRRLGDVTSNYREATEEMQLSDEDL